ncbi:MAG: hypothetical protein V7724_10130 [Sediminicola sp.]|tara:strand:- start:17347 stop:17844 length:498 start_codon:yes stop_codon:yes gene_type:complete
MKRTFLFVFLGLLLSCDDGDLQVETINFDDSAIDFCGTATTATTLMFKINGDEALILTLQGGLLKNEATTDTIISTVPAQSKLSYRIFSGTVAKGYFCDALPPTDPVVLEEITAEDGEVMITTAMTDSVTFAHTIRLRGISFVNESGSRVTDLRVNNFGAITTRN